MTHHSAHGPRLRHPVRVLYVDTDKGGVVHHAAYLRFLEAARVELMRHAGVDYRRFEEETGMAIPVAEARVRYRRPARFDDALEVETWVGAINRAKLRFDSRIWRGGELLTEAEITCACVILREERVCSVAHELRITLDPHYHAPHHKHG